LVGASEIVAEKGKIEQRLELAPLVLFLSHFFFFNPAFSFVPTLLTGRLKKVIVTMNVPVVIKALSNRTKLFENHKMYVTLKELTAIGLKSHQ